MSCVPEKDHDPISVINKWVSAINFAVGKINPMAGAVTGQFAIATQSGASAVALANGDGTAITAIPGVSVSAPTMAWFAKIGGWVSVIAKAAGVAVPGVGLVAIGMTMVSAAAAAAANKTFSDIVTDPGFWEAIGNGAPDYYLKSKYGITLNELMNSLLDALLTGEMKPLGCPIEPIRDGFSQATEIPSPIILDLDGDGVETTSIGHGTYFDHSADGFAEKTAWVGKDDGLLVWDRNNNGQIDSGRELFGSETLLANGMKAINGFEALKAFDANGDGVIDANDPVFAQLRVWVDANTDARTGEGELLTLEQAGVRSINLTYSESGFVDAQGNAHRQVGSYTTTDGQTRAATDVWVKTDATYSLPTEWVEVPEDIALLPDAQGYGKVRDLRQAMAANDRRWSLIA